MVDLLCLTSNFNFLFFLGRVHSTIQIAELFTEQQCLIHCNEYNNEISYMLIVSIVLVDLLFNSNQMHDGTKCLQKSLSLFTLNAG